MIRVLARFGWLAFMFAGFVVVTTGRHVFAECETSELTGTTTCFLTAPALPARFVPIGDGSTSSFIWSQVPLNVDEARTRGAVCQRTNTDGTTVTVETGAVYVVALYAADGTQVVAPHIVCVFADDPAPEPPPPPPTGAEFVEAARQAATLSTSLNPRPGIGGLTGLDTWLWCVSPGEVQVSVALRGWTAAATLSPVEFVWQVGGVAHARFPSQSCGSEASPAASWTPETLGEYSVTLTSTWAGSWTLQFNGVAAGTFPLGPFQFAAPAVAYPVSEYRGVLTPPGGSEP